MVDVREWNFSTLLLAGLFFFFSSRRRHTRLTCDWSSDVCSSDLVRKSVEGYRFLFSEGTVQVTVSLGAATFKEGMNRAALLEAADAQLYHAKHREIGRASCRERV